MDTIDSAATSLFCTEVRTRRCAHPPLSVPTWCVNTFPATMRLRRLHLFG
jgi:hypothetical protein